MEEISLTTGQFQILLNMCERPATGRTSATVAFVPVLLRARNNGHTWHVKMSPEDTEFALDLFMEHQGTVRSPGAKQALSRFVRESKTARRFYDERQAPSDVPRETSREPES